MFDAIGDILPNAIAIAISPLPIIAVVLMLMSAKPKQLGLGFMLGWLIGVFAVTTVFTLIASAIPVSDAADGSRPVAGVVQLILGALLLLLGARQWRSRPAPGTEPELPAWMSKTESMKTPGAFTLSLALAALNPKNLLLAAAAGMVIGRTSVPLSGQLATVVIFTVIASLSVMIPVLFAVIAPQKTGPILSGLRTWLATNNATIMTVVLVVIGAKVIGTGLGNF